MAPPLREPTLFEDRDLAIVPIERAETIPSRWYVDPAVYAVEMERIFSRTWQGVGYAAAVREPGSHFVCTVADNPVIVVRGADDTLRAFYNVCRHRGGPLATEDGCSKVLQCKYHGWTYTLDGALRGVPRFDRVELFDKKDYGLIPVPVAEWDGLVFVNLDEDAAPVDAWLGDVAARLGPIRLGDMRFAHRADYDLRCNWKVYIDNYLEGYHVPFVHPELCDVYEYHRYEVVAHEGYLLQSAPLAAGDSAWSSGGGEALYFFVFPNFMLNVLPGRMQSNLVTPLGPDRTRVTFWYFYDDVTSPEAVRHIEDDIAYSDRVQIEDVEICEHVQRGLASRAYDRGRFSVEQEVGVYDFQRRVREAFRGAGSRD